MINVYAWPPVGVVGTEWTEEAPVQRSRSILTGKDYVSAYARKRRKVTLTVSALSLNRSGAGYSEMLKRYLDGGIHAVRLNSYPINWWQDASVLDPDRRSDYLFWENAGQDIDWTNNDLPLYWFTGPILVGDVTGSAGSRVLTVGGLPPNTIIARPGDFVTIYQAITVPEGQQAQIISESKTDADGVAVIRTFEDLNLGSDVRVSIGSSATGVFRAEKMPRAVQPLNSNWTYTWQFREIFEDEVGGFTEVDPWN